MIRAQPGTLVFIHLPKAGGMTLQSIVGRQFPARARFDIDGESVESVQRSVAELRALPAAEREAIRCVRGHVPFGVGQWLRQPLTHLTMLRDPVARLVSDYNYAMSLPHHAVNRQLKGRIISLEEFVDLREADGLTNLHTRMLCGSVNWDHLADWPPLSPALLAQAKTNLDSFAGVGLTERFDESVMLYSRALGWTNCWYVHENVTELQRADRRTLPEALLARIQDCNAYDLDLYAHAVALFEARMKAAGPGFDEEVDAFRTENAARRHRLQASRRIRNLLGRARHRIRQVVMPALKHAR